MVNYNEQQLNNIFSALADPTRRKMLMRLTEQDMSVADLAAPFDMTKSAVTKHVKVLENAGLLKRSIEGRVHRCQLAPSPLADASDWLQFYQAFWQNKLDALDDFLTRTDNDPITDKKPK